MLQGVGEWNQRQNANPQAQASAGGFSMPYTVSQEAVTARQGVQYNGMAHSFAGMCVQFILFMGIDAGHGGAACSGAAGCGSACKPRRSRAT